jgi:replicative DNA helicase
MFKKYIHYDQDLEKAIIGIILLEVEAFDMVQDVLTPEMFYNIALGEIFAAFQEMKKARIPIDLLTACNYLHNRPDNQYLKPNQIAPALSKATGEVVNSANLLAWANMVKTLYIRREWSKIKAAPSDSLESMAEAQAKITSLQAVGGAMDFLHIDDTLIDLWRHVAKVEESTEAGIPTGCKRLDIINGGYTSGQFIVLGARPSVGKSAFMGKAVLDAADKGYHVGVISLEMPREQIAARLGSIVSGVDFWRIYRAKLGDDKERQIAFDKINRLAGKSIYIADKVRVNLSDIRSAAYRMVRAKKLHILYLDYLQLVDTSTGEKNSNREREVANLSRGLKILAMELSIPIVALAQLNRDIEKAGGPVRYPKLSDLRESGSLEQDADAVIFLHRDWKAGKTTDENGRTTEDRADIVVPKWRNGEDTNGTGPIKMGFDGPKMKFLDEIADDRGIPRPPVVTGARLYIEEKKTPPPPPVQITMDIPPGFKRVDMNTGEILEEDEPF